MSSCKSLPGKSPAARCFFCLGETSTHLLFHDDQYQYNVSGATSLSLRSLLRYLKLLDFDYRERSEIIVSSCSACVEMHETFTELYKTLEVTKLQLHNCIRKISEKMTKKSSYGEKGFGILGRASSCSSGGNDEALRAAVIDKCVEKLSSSLPRVLASPLIFDEPRTSTRPQTNLDSEVVSGKSTLPQTNPMNGLKGELETTDDFKVPAIVNCQSLKYIAPQPHKLKQSRPTPVMNPSKNAISLSDPWRNVKGGNNGVKKIKKKPRPSSCLKFNKTEMEMKLEDDFDLDEEELEDLSNLSVLVKELPTKEMKFDVVSSRNEFNSKQQFKPMKVPSSAKVKRGKRKLNGEQPCPYPHCKAIARPLKHHLLYFHPEHYFPKMRESTVKREHFQKILADLLFRDFLQPRFRSSCSICGHMFNFGNKFMIESHLKMHLVNHHFEIVSEKLKQIQKSPGLAKQLQTCNPKGSMCRWGCGTYLPKARGRHLHEKEHCSINNEVGKSLQKQTVLTLQLLAR